MTAESESADRWAEQAAELPLAFAQVREDPRLDLEVCDELPEHPVIVMIASGGETAIQVGRQRPARLHLVDMNPAQLALARVKWHLAERLSVADTLELLGHRPMEPADRGEKLQAILSELQLAPDVFGPPEQVASWGLDGSGRYEQTFVALRSELSVIEPEIQQALTSAVPDDSAASPLDPTTQAGGVFDKAFETVMSQANLVRLFGEGATQNPRQSFASHFAWRVRLALARPDRCDNPFLWQMLAGRFPPHAPYDWLLPEAKQRSLDGSRVTYHCGQMIDVLRSFTPASVDMIHLSNILDWLSPDEATATLHCAERALGGGGKVILRQLNSSLQILQLDSRLVWDVDHGERMVEQDRSFFYPHIFVGTCR